MSLLEKGSVYEQPSVYNQGGSGGGGGGISVDGWGLVKIGGEDYGYMQLADKLITTRNLDFLPSGITIGTETTTSPRACYYNNDSTQAKKRGYGLMYNWAAVKYIIDNNLLPEGWGILTESVCNLIQYVFNPSYNVGEGKNTCRKHVDWASSNWNDYGDNRSHLSLMPCGRRQYGSWDGLGDYCRIWTSSTKKVFSLAVSPYSLWPGFDYVDDSEFTYIRLFKQMTELDLNYMNRGGDNGFVIIDGTAYSTIKINGVEWCQQNLMYVSPSWSTDGSWFTVSQATNSNKRKLNKYGFFYTKSQLSYIINNLDMQGFHVATKADYESLASIPSVDLRSSELWANNDNGTNASGLQFYPCGHRTSGNSFNGNSVGAEMWTGTDEGSGFYEYQVTQSGIQSITIPDQSFAIPIRLCR